MIKEVFGTKSVLSNHSTVTDCFSTNTFDPKNSNKKDVESILFSFDLIIKIPKLIKTSCYSFYQ